MPSFNVFTYSLISCLVFPIFNSLVFIANVNANWCLFYLHIHLYKHIHIYIDRLNYILSCDLYKAFCDQLIKFIFSSFTSFNCLSTSIKSISKIHSAVVPKNVFMTLVGFSKMFQIIFKLYILCKSKNIYCAILVNRLTE